MGGGSSVISQQNASKKKQVKRLQKLTKSHGNKLKVDKKIKYKKDAKKPKLKKGFCAENKHMTESQHRQAVSCEIVSGSIVTEHVYHGSNTLNYKNISGLRDVFRLLCCVVLYGAYPYHL